LPEDFTVDRQKLIAGARGLSALSHPNVTTLFDVGEHESRVYLAFEFQKGQSLRAESAGRPMNVRRAVEVAIQIADAVADAHAHGFGHGGLSPTLSSSAPKGAPRFRRSSWRRRAASTRTATTAA
jgi:serine/threonine-protein kinase